MTTPPSAAKELNFDPLEEEVPDFVPLNSVWDCPKIEKLIHDGVAAVQCHHCGRIYNHQSATKIMKHLARIKNNDITQCAGGRNMTMEEKLQYADLYQRKLEKKRKSLEVDERAKHADESYRKELLESLPKKKKAPSSIGSLTKAVLMEQEKEKIQTKITNNVCVSNETAFTLRICELVYSLGLSFKLVEEEQFRGLLTAAKGIPSTYKFPSRNQVGGKFLQLQYDKRCKYNDQQLLKEAETYGMCFFGDGATIKKMPLLNILGSCGAFTTCLDIVDCTAHMAEGGKKDASFIAECVVPHLERLDPDKRLVDLLIYDGAKNVQKSGHITEGDYPRVTTIHGVEHVIALFFSDVADIPEMKALIGFHRVAYSYFGGAMHAPHAMLMKHSELHFGRRLGLLRVAGTRMAGHYYALARMYRVKNVLASTVTSSEFIKQKRCTHFSHLLKSEKIWDVVALVLGVLFPVLFILRLADSREPGFDRLYYYVRLADKLMVKHADKLNNILKTEPFTLEKVLHFNKHPEGERAGRLKKADDEDEESDNEEDNEDEQSTDDEVSVESYDDIDSDDDDIEEQRLGQDSDDDLSTEGEGMGYEVKRIWKKRREKLLSAYAYAGWMLAPQHDIRADVEENHNGKHRKATEDLLIKVLGYEADGNKVQEGKMKMKFWEEFEHFAAKTGPYNGREEIWNFSCSSHLWHKINSVRYTKYLGRFACLVLSKPLGIGEAERNWGAVKHLKTDKRSHLSADAVRMQTTIFASHSAAKAAKKQEKRMLISNLREDKLLSQDDLEQDFLKDQQPGAISSPVGKKRPKRIFKAWLEEWEKEAVKKQDPAHEAHLLAKYGGLTWYDYDCQKNFRNSPSETFWRKRVKGDKRNAYVGYCIVALREDYDPEDDETYDNLMIEEGCLLHTEIPAYYKKNPSEHIVVYTTPEEMELEVDSDDDD